MFVISLSIQSFKDVIIIRISSMSAGDRYIEIVFCVFYRLSFLILLVRFGPMLVKTLSPYRECFSLMLLGPCFYHLSYSAFISDISFLYFLVF